jgi:hypothetical protein
MPITLTCACGRSLRIKDEFAGRKVRCPECQVVLTVPIQEELLADEDAADLLLDGTPPPEPQRRESSRELDVPVEDRQVYRAGATPMGAAKPPQPARKKEKPSRRAPRVAFEEGWFGSLNAGIVGGILMMLIAIIWFVVGLAGGVIFFYPPVLLVIGLFAMIKGFISRG